MKRIAKKVGINKPVGPHTLRHAVITAALDAGVPLRDIQEAASHADPRTTMRYDRARVSLDRHATHIVAAYVAGAADSAIVVTNPDEDCSPGAFRVLVDELLAGPEPELDAEGWVPEHFYAEVLGVIRRQTLTLSLPNPGAVGGRTAPSTAPVCPQHPLLRALGTLSPGTPLIARSYTALVTESKYDE